MFQRFKDAIDSRIAEEQARQRAALQSTSHSSQPNSTAIQQNIARNVSPSERPRQKKHSTFSAGRAPHPSNFETESILADGISGGNLSTDEIPGHNTQVQDSDSRKTIPDMGKSISIADGGEDSIPDQPDDNLPTEVRVKLKKLGKLEGKYGELLNAYRIAHGRVQVIEPFEASLRENTPLTSIDDPIAFLEYLNQINLKSNMVLDELKRVALERDKAQKRTKELEKETQAIKAEAADFKHKCGVEPIAKSLVSPRSSIDLPYPKEEEIPDSKELVKAQSSSIAGRISGLPFLSPGAKASDSPHDEEDTEDFFSYDKEIPRLQTELERRQLETTDLKMQVSNLARDLLVAKESTEGMVQTLESTTRELQILREANKASEKAIGGPQALTEESQQENGAVSPRDEVSKPGTAKEESHIAQLEVILNERDKALAAKETAEKQAEAYSNRSRKEAADLRREVAQKENRENELEALLAATLSKRPQAQQIQSESTSQKQIGVLNNILKSLRSQLETAEKEINDLKLIKRRADAELESLRQCPNRDTEQEETKSESKNEVIAECVKHGVEQPSAKYFGFVNDGSFSLTGDMPDAFRRFSEVLKDTRPELYEALISPEKSGRGASTLPDVPLFPNDAAKKNKKKKKKGKGSGGSSTGHQVHDLSIKVTENLDDVESELQMSNITTSADGQNLKSQLSQLQVQVKEKDAAITRLSEKIKDQNFLCEEIETLRDDLLHQGEEHVEARQVLQATRSENQVLQERLIIVEKQLSEASEAGADRAHQDLSSEFEDMKSRHLSLERDLAASEEVAVARFKDVTDLREVLSKAQPELRSLRSEVEELRLTKHDLKKKADELSRLSMRHDDLKVDIKHLSQKLVERESNLKDLQQKFASEQELRGKADEGLRAQQADLQTAELLREAATRARSEAFEELSKIRADYTASEARSLVLEKKVSDYAQKVDAMNDDISLKSTLHESSQAIVVGLREQTLELSTQAREASERAESLEEEQAEAQRLLTERSREAETMRRLLADAEGRTASKLREMKDRMEAAIEERGQIEDEASTNKRKMAREIEDLRDKTRDATKALKAVEEEKDELERSERLLKRKMNEQDTVAESARAEVAEVQSAIQHLRQALDQREKEGIQLEQQRIDTKQTLDEMQEAIERLQKANKRLSEELKSSQQQRKANIRPAAGLEQEATASRRSLDPVFSSQDENYVTASSRSPITISSTSRSSTPIGQTAPAIDYVYLKNVLLQFLEQKDKNHQKQLIPVLGMLLNFDRNDEQKWMAAISVK